MSAILFYNNASTTLAGPISSSATTATLATGTGALFSPPPGAGQHFVLTFNDAATGALNEIVWVTSISGDTITIVRAQEGTAAQAWNTGDLASNFWTAGQAAALFNSSNIVTIPVTGASTTYNSSQINSNVTRSNAGAVMVDTLPGTGVGILSPGSPITITNSDTSAILAIQAGAGTVLANTTRKYIMLGPGQAATFVADGFNNYWAITRPGRVKLAAGTNHFFVNASTGSDSANTGLTTGSPFLTPQELINFVYNNFDFNQAAVEFDFTGAFTSGVTVPGPFQGSAGASSVVMNGSSTPGAVSITVVGGQCFTAQNGGSFTVQGFTLAGSGSSPIGINAAAGGIILMGPNIIFGSMPGGQHIACGGAGAQIQALNNYSISGGAAFHRLVTGYGSFLCNGLTVTITGGPTFSSAFADSITGNLQDGGGTFSGSVTGQRYAVSLNGVINTNAGGANYFPGTIAGAASAGGQYA